MCSRRTQGSRSPNLSPSGALSPDLRRSGLARAVFRLQVVLNVLLLLTSGPPARAAENPPVQVLLALDTSGSMRTNDPLRLLPKAAALLVNLLDGQDSLGLLRFDEAPALLLAPGPLTPDRRRQCHKELARLAPRGRYTDIPAALEAGLPALGPPSSLPRALILITDGKIDLDPGKGDAQSAVRRLHQEILPAYRRANVFLFTVAFSAKSDQKLLQELAAGSRGAFLLVERASDLHKALFWLYEKLKQPQLAPVIGNRFLIDAGVEEAVLIASRNSPDLPVELTDPLGGKITPKEASRQVRWFATPAFDMVTLANPRPGFWTLNRVQDGEGKVILLTDLTLICPHIPGEAGSDEELLVGAAICDQGRPVTHAELLERTTFEATLTPADGNPHRLELAEPLADQRGFWPSGTRVGRFPSVGTSGTARLNVRVLGPTFQRERNFSIQVVAPWYREEFVQGRVAGFPRLAFSPTRELPVGMHGWVSLRPATGGVAAVLFQPGARGAFSLTLPGPDFRPLTVDLRLSGRATSGRPLCIRPPSRLLEPSTAAGQSSLPDQGTEKGFSAKFRRLRAHWRKAIPSRIWLPAGLAALAAALAAVALLAHRIDLSRLADVFSPPRGESKEERLLRAARVEALLQEKSALEARLKELEERLRRTAAEKADLLGRIERQSLKLNEKAKVIEELEERLKQAELETKAVQEEYMSLYARSQKEKQILKKG